MSRTITITLMAAATALAAGCGTTVAKSTAPAQGPGTTSPSPSSQAAQVGDKFTITSGDAKYDVTLLSVDQLAQPATEFESPEPGHHLAATQFRVTAITKTDENANDSATVTGSNEQAYTPSLSDVAAGTNFAAGQILLQPGSSLVGWVSFQLPAGVRVTKVQWTPLAGFSSNNAQWLVKSSAAASPGGAPTSTATAGQANDPADVVTAYFDAINLRDYQKAWNLGGKNTGSSYASFVSGFKTTEMVSVNIVDVSGDVATAVVTARLTTLETDGSSKVFQGTYTVKDGVIVRFNVRQVS